MVFTPAADAGLVARLEAAVCEPAPRARPGASEEEDAVDAWFESAPEGLAVVEIAAAVGDFEIEAGVVSGAAIAAGLKLEEIAAADGGALDASATEVAEVAEVANVESRVAVSGVDVGFCTEATLVVAEIAEIAAGADCGVAPS